MATIAVARLATIADEVKIQPIETPIETAVHAEVDVLARALCAVSQHSSLTDALRSFYEFLKPEEARERSAQVLERMRMMFPDDLADDLPEACGYERPWTGRTEQNEADKRSLTQRFAVPAVYLIGGTMLALSIVGSITTVRYLLGR